MDTVTETPEGEPEARALPRSASDTQPGHVTLGVARFGKIHFGIPIENLAEVARVTELRPLVDASEHVLGALELRGLLVPVADLSRLMEMGAGSREAPPFAAILRSGNRLMGMGVDEIDGMTRVPAGAIQRKGRAAVPQGGREVGEPARTASLTVGSILHDGRVITVLDPKTLLSRCEQLAVPAAPGAPRSATLPEDRISGGGCPAPRGTDRLLVFSAGGAELALRATEIQGTVPRTSIEENALTSGICLGSIEHHKQRIPVLQTEMLTGLGTPSRKRDAEIVLLRVDDRQRIGLAVDQIERMMTMERARMYPPPALMANTGGVLEGILPAAGDERQVFLLSPPAILANPTVRELGKLSVRRAKGAKDAFADSPGRNDIQRERLRYLVFRAGAALAAPAAQILRIVEPPAIVTPCSSCVPGVTGVFQFDGRPALFVDLVHRLGLRRDVGQRATSRVLMVRDGAHLVGFGADDVDGIETSAWKRVGTGGHDAGTIVQLGRGANRRIVPVLDLARLASASAA